MPSRAPSSTSSLRTAWDRGQHGWPAAFPLVQFPNAPLGVAIVGMVGAQLTSGDAYDLLVALGRVGLVAWAYDELARGVNPFRRLLGLGMLIFLVMAIAA